MKPHAKRIFTVLLSLLLAALPSAALCAFAADTPAVLASGYCGGEGDGTNLTWKITDDGVLTISGLGAMADYMETRVSEETGETITSHSATPWEEAIMQHVMQNCDPALLEQLNDGAQFSYETVLAYQQIEREARTLLRAAVLEEGVASVGAYAFGGSSVETVSLPSTLRVIGERAFYESDIRSVELPEGLVSIGPWAFYETRLASLVLPSTLQSVGERAFDYTRLHGITVRGNAQYVGDLPVICSMYAPCTLTAAQFDTAYTVSLMASVLLYLINDGVYGSGYAKELELWGLAEDGEGEAYVAAWFSEHLFAMERYYDVRIEWTSYFGVRDALIAEIGALLDADLTAAQLSVQTGVKAGFTDAFCNAVKAYRQANGGDSDNAAFLYGRLLDEDQKIKYKLQTSSLTLEELLYRRRNELSELYAAVLAVCGEEVSDLETAKAVALAKVNADHGTSFTEEDVLLVYPTYQVNYGALNDAFNAKYALTGLTVPAVPSNCGWYTAAEAAAGVADNDGGSIYPMQWYTVRSCSETTLAVAAAAGLTAKTLDHTWELTSTAVPTCTSVGTKTYTCIYCGAEKTEDYAPVLNHTPVNVDATEPTYDEHGYTAGVYCAQCDTWLSGHEVIHNTFGHREVLRQPTTEEEGSVIITCTVCGEQGLYAIEKLAPSEPEPEPAEPDWGLFEPIRKAVNSVVNWILRLIKWLGKK
ncbi:MAG: leucine-rich repeat domain-containing protein [Clostridia bacterium]|nr:leucine-rich repeat domain-containing protein [Clostridia bacterium]